MSIANTWRWLPDWSQGVTERLEWRTDVQQGYDGEEERYPLRRVPRRSWSWSMVLTEDERRKFEVEYYASASEDWCVPLWWDVEPASLASGATSYTRSALPADRELPQFGYLVIADRDGAVGKGPYIKTLSPSSETYTWTGGLPRAFPAGRVYAARMAKVKLDGIEQVTAGVTRYSVSAEAVADFVVGSAIDSSEWDVRPDRAQPLAASREILQERIDYGGAWAMDVRQTRPIRGNVHDHTLSARADVYVMRRRLAWLLGRYQLAHVPTFAADMVALAPVLGSTIDVRPIGWTSDAPTQFVLIERDGTAWRRTVTGSSTVGTTETLTFTPSIGSLISLADIRQISWSVTSRLDSDAIEIIWTTPQVAQMSLPWREVIV